MFTFLELHRSILILQERNILFNEKIFNFHQQRGHEGQQLGSR